VITELHANGPALDVADKLMLFGQFVGDWEFDDYSFNMPDGSKQTARGEWHFGWILKGRAVQDVWIAVPLEGSAFPGEYGTTIRFYNPNIDAWHVAFVGPVTQSFYILTARNVDGEIVLEGKENDGSRMRWIFSEITGNSFRWRSVVSGDDGETWQPRSAMSLRRASHAMGLRNGNFLKTSEFQTQEHFE
jgi:hypothetical protein